MATTLVWDAIEDRTYERGIDRAVIYLDDGTAIPWSGIVSINETQTVNTTPIYFEGNKVSSITETDSFAASISALTYPDIVPKLEGNERINHGIFLANQYAQPFSMSYRSGIGDAIHGDLSGYKIHILFGLNLIPKDRPRNTINADASVDAFEWDLVSIPPTVGNYRPTAHIVLVEDQIPTELKDELYLALYGDGVEPPSFTSVEDLIDQILSYTLWRFEFSTEEDEEKTFNAISFFDENLYLDNPDAEEGDDDWELWVLEDVEIEVEDEDTYLLLNGYGSKSGCDPRTIGSIQENDEDGSCYHLVRSALATDELSHYIGTAPLGSQETQPVWRVTQIFFGPPVTIQVRKNIRWTERES